MTCARCPREVIGQRTWNKASQNQRQIWLTSGATTLQGRGMCRACYLRAWRAGEIEHRRTPLKTKPQPHPCARCGIATNGVFCADCVDVLSDGAA